MIRDFSKQNFKDLSDIAKDCSNEQDDLGDHINDVILWLGRVTGIVSSSNCGNKLTAYQKNVIDSLDMGSNEVYEIFKKVWADDEHSGASISRIGDALETFTNGIQNLTDEIELGNSPSFTADGINRNAKLNNGINAFKKQNAAVKKQYDLSVRDLALSNLKAVAKDAPGALLGVAGSALGFLVAPDPVSKVVCAYKFTNSLGKEVALLSSAGLAVWALCPWSKDKAGLARASKDTGEVDGWTDVIGGRADAAKTEKEKNFWKAMEMGSLVLDIYSDVYDIKTWFSSPDAAESPAGIAEKTKQVEELTEAKEKFETLNHIISFGVELPPTLKDPAKMVDTTKWAIKKSPVGKVFYEGKKLYDDYKKYDFPDMVSSTVDFWVDAMKEWMKNNGPSTLIC